MIFRLLYDLAISAYQLGIRLSPSEKARQWRAGRHGLLAELDKHDLKGCVWFHCASVGEFEQARPVIEGLKKELPNKFLLTFFSPSGYEMHRNYPEVDLVSYLPLDRKKDMRRFVERVQPSAFVLVKYEVWYHLLSELTRRNTPRFLIAARFRANQVYFRSLSRPLLNLLKSFTAVLVQDQTSMDILQSKGFMNASMAGDPRYDRVIQLAREDYGADYIEREGRPILVAGSTWPKDEEMLLKWYEGVRSEWRLLIAPHEWDDKRLNSLKGFAELSVYSEGGKLDSETDVLVLDTKGVLSKVYRYGRLSYVGGGFEGEVHNILEPLVYGRPVMFGPDYHKSNESKEALSRGFALSADNAADLGRAVEKLTVSDHGSAIKSYFDENAHSAQRIQEVILDSL